MIGLSWKKYILQGAILKNIHLYNIWRKKNIFMCVRDKRTATVSCTLRLRSWKNTEIAAHIYITLHWELINIQVIK